MPGVYISWPFCAQKCSYCNFASGVYHAEQRRLYLHALRQEIRNAHWNWTPDTVYLGGGTPSLMTEVELADALSGVPGFPWKECTMEAAPGTLSQQVVRMWRNLGVNRVSFGVQSFVERELRQTGRKHNAETVARECDMLRQAGISNINIDLIAGLPHQTSDSWRLSLDWIAKLHPPHASVYMLEVDEDSRLGLEILEQGGRYGAAAVPDDEAITSFYLDAARSLAGQGIPRYEISNFARPGWESQHNLKYWRLEPYLGFGVDAHSCDDGWRWGNEEDLSRYLSAIDKGKSPRTNVTPFRPIEERFLVGLRLDAGLSWDPSEHLPGIRQRIYARIAQGLLAVNNGKLRFTEKGLLLSNEVFEDFLDADVAAISKSP